MRHITIGMVLLSLVAGCTTAPEGDCNGQSKTGDPYIGEPVFYRCAGLSVSVDRTSYTIGDTLSLTVAFTPLFSGVGEVAIWFLPLESRLGQQGVVVTEPRATSSGGIVWKMEADLKNDGRFIIPIEFVVNDNTPYHITASVRFKSIFDPVTELFYRIGSDEQENVFGPLDHTSYGGNDVLKLPRPTE